MPSITDEDFDRLLCDFERESIHLETRDSYGTVVELPHMAKWSAGRPDDLKWLNGWCSTLRGHVEAGRSVRRDRVVSEPLSEYQRWSHSIAQPMVDAGEDIRWVPRRLVSSVAFLGNDFYLFDDRLVVFLIYAGNGLALDKVASSEPHDIRLCRRAFEVVWLLSVPHRDYQPGNSAKQARRALGSRLRDLRKGAGLTARDLAEATGQHYTRVSKIENGVQAPTDHDVRRWCRACAAAEQVADLPLRRDVRGTESGRCVRA